MYIHLIRYPQFNVYMLAESESSKYQDTSGFQYEVIQSKKYSGPKASAMAVTKILFQVEAVHMYLLPGNRYFRELINLEDFPLVRPGPKCPEKDGPTKTFVVRWTEDIYSVLYSEYTQEYIEYLSGEVLFQLDSPKYTTINNDSGYFTSEEPITPDYLMYLYKSGGEA